MNARKTMAVGALAMASTLAACGDNFLEGPGLTTSPNAPSQATAEDLYHSMQVSQFGWHTGDLARHASMHVQQMAGIDRQYVDRDRYSVTEADLSFFFSRVYTGGGLVDMREIQRLSDEAGNRTLAGTTRVWEGLQMGMAASVWGAIPYSEAVSGIAQPRLDPQHEVYRQVQEVLARGIADLQSGAGAMPAGLDLVYGGNRARWIAAANTLRARYAMHWVEAQLAGGEHAQRAQVACGGNCLTQAVTWAGQGINSPAAADQFRTVHSATTGEQNLWHQFMFIQRQGMIAAGRTLVTLLQERNDPRLAQFFAPATAGGAIAGAPPGTSGNFASLNPTTRGAPGFAQPIVTYEENQLILAEAQARLGNTGAALTALNNARSAVNLPARSGLAGADLLREIAIEQYIALFQNIEAWNTWQRTCTPQLRPVTGTQVIARWLYGVGERNANPNVPVPAQQPTRNANDVNPCPVPAA
jgi:starch-binding outer membrane protein, SusD/RagB family